jgi:hypothetical protein
MQVGGFEADETPVVWFTTSEQVVAHACALLITFA